MSRRRSLIFGVGFLAPLLVLVLWFASAASSRCDLYQNLGYVSLAKGTLAPAQAQLRLAEKWLSKPLQAGCPAAPATFGLGQSYAEQGQLSAAASAFNNGSERIDLRHLLTGKIYEAMGRRQDALAEYRQLPLDAAAYFYKLGDREAIAGNYDQALRDYSVSTMINPKAAKAYYGAALVYWRRLGDEDKALELVQQGLAVDQGRSVARSFYQGLVCYYDEKIDCAIADWVSAARTAPTNDTDSTARYLAYEMLSRALVSNRAAADRQGATAMLWIMP